MSQKLRLTKIKPHMARVKAQIGLDASYLYRNVHLCTVAITCFEVLLSVIWAYFPK